MRDSKCQYPKGACLNDQKNLNEIFLATLVLGIANIMHRAYNIIYLYILIVKYCLRTKFWKYSWKFFNEGF